jgi:hypothetical protein
MVANAIVLLVGLFVGLIVVAVMAFRERGKSPDRDDEKTTYLPRVDWYKPKTRAIFFLDKEMLTRMGLLVGEQLARSCGRIERVSAALRATGGEEIVLPIQPGIFGTE